MIEVTGKYVTGALAIRSDSWYVFDQWCIAGGQSGSRTGAGGRGNSQTSLSIKTAHKRHPVKSIKTNLAIAIQRRAP